MATTFGCAARQHFGTALVTGAGSGIGLATARALAAAGYSVALASLEADAPSLTETMRYYQADIAQTGQHGALLARVVADLGPVTCLVNSAGVTSLVRGDMLALSAESFDRLFAINLRGTFFLTQAVARHMLDCQPANTVPRTIITIGSANAEIVGETRADYCMSKAAVAMMSKLFAARLASAGIAVFEIRPGIIHTAMTSPAVARYDRFVAEGGVPMSRWGEPDDVAATVVTLARGDIPYATGIHLDIGGGMQLHRV
jgi:NAD(P)-dependent dehydrogenase (short-subunit alcohol dehydrogenase family)